MLTNNFIRRHNGISESEYPEMLKMVGAATLDQLIDETIPEKIRLQHPLNLPDGINEYEYLAHLKSLGAKNKLFKTYIGLGYYNTIVPGVIQRNILETPPVGTLPIHLIRLRFHKAGLRLFSYFKL